MSMTIPATLLDLHTEPGGRYDDDGSLYIDLGSAVLDGPILPLTRLALTADLPNGAFDWEPVGWDLLWIRFDHARSVEQRLRRMFPSATITAAANPAYRGTAVPR